MYTYKKQFLKAEETGNFLTLGKRMRELKDGWNKLTFHSTPLCTVLFFYMYMSSPTKIIFNSWPLFLTSSLTTCVILCYHLPQFSPF